MEITQLRLARMAVFCYLIGDEASETCALVDPAFDTDRILSEAQRRQYRITHIINTHGHSDHTAGNQALKAATGAQLLSFYLPTLSPYHPLNRGSVRDLISTNL